MDKITGYVEQIVYRNTDNGYTVLALEMDKDDIVCVGNFEFVKEGEYLELEGEYTTHKIYGEQFKMKSYCVKVPEDKKSIERYLASGAIKGLGAKLAERIVKKFGEDTFKIIDEEPERLSEVKGISARMAQAIAGQIEEERDMRQAMMFLQSYGISSALTVKIYNRYGSILYDVVKNNPYKLAEDIHGVGFKMADEIAAKVGIPANSEQRIRCGIIYLLLQAAGNGNVYLPMEELVSQIKQLTGCEEELTQKCLTDMAIEKQIVIKGEEKQVYYINYYYTELNIARLLHDIDVRVKFDRAETYKKIKEIEKRNKIELDELQREAVFEGISNGFLVITGGPGTGKTTTINTMIKFFESEGLEVMLAAPTGRAAKRITEATGVDAKTIHRMLELSGGIDDSREGVHFDRNEENPLEADVIIVDEMSMVDIFLMRALLKAIVIGTRLVLVGDVDQLPSVGPGNVLRDIIESGCFNVVKLEKIFRQAGESEIVVNAHKINRGVPIELKANSKDFIFVKRDNPNIILGALLTLVKEKLPKYVDAESFDVQILTPMKKGPLGVEKINEIMQNYLNPQQKGKYQVERGDTVFRVGDKVMHIKNNYQLEWECRGRYGIPYDSGLGVFNGETGIIRNINEYAQTLEVEFDENKYVTYTFNDLNELELAYAITVHKSQGSEYPAVILPLLGGPKMLMNRNILYTAVTRAKTCVCIVGSQETFNVMVENISEAKRYSGLKNRIIEVKQEE